MPYFMKRPIPIEAVQQTQPFSVKTLEGELAGKAGDYLVIGAKGEQDPCDKDIFESTYYEVDVGVYEAYYNERDIEGNLLRQRPDPNIL